MMNMSKEDVATLNVTLNQAADKCDLSEGAMSNKEAIGLGNHIKKYFATKGHLRCGEIFMCIDDEDRDRIEFFVMRDSA